MEQVVYSATMTVGSTTQNPIPLFAWDGDASLLENDALTDAYFVYANETYEFIRITTNATSGGVLYIAFDATNSGSMSDAAVRSVMTLYVDGTAFALGDADYSQPAIGSRSHSLTWRNIGFTWAASDTVELEIRVTE